ncbi:putative bifunctional diguanylate cyclase/phosphodiesterase [Caldicellulosiruptoraceae bacterium PP1]
MFKSNKNDKKITIYKDALRITLIYTIIASLWIFFSDSLLGKITKDINDIKYISMYKGLFFVFITSALLFFLIKSKLFEINKSHIKLAKSYQNLKNTHQKLIIIKKELNEQYKALKSSHEKLIRNAYYDFITGLPNRILFYEMLEEMINIHKKNKKRLAVIYLDIDNFKTINDIVGHIKADNLLREFSQKLLTVIKDGVFLSRIGGDEFGFIVPEINDNIDIEHCLKKLNGVFRGEWKLDNYDFFISISMGISIYPDDAYDAATLVQNADIALNKAKTSGKNKWCYFQKEFNVEIIKINEIENGLRHALSNNEFYLVYQPIYKISDEKVKGAEALLRWQHPQKGMISPNDFIPIAENSGLIIPIGNWVLKDANRQINEWKSLCRDDFSISINTSIKQFQDSSFLNIIKEFSSVGLLNPNNINIEITETSAMEDVETTINALYNLKELGLKVILDDFGIGYSSLNYLQTLPIDMLKIDKSFIMSMMEASKETKIIKNLIELAHVLRIEVVAEGVETEEQFKILKDQGCDYIQGYLISKPISAGEFRDKFLPKKSHYDGQ